MVKCSPRFVSRTFAALADPTRRRILEHLAQGDRCVTDLARPYSMSLPAVSKHLRVLENAGLIRRRSGLGRSGLGRSLMRFGFLLQTRRRLALKVVHDQR